MSESIVSSTTIDSKNIKRKGKQPLVRKVTDYLVHVEDVLGIG